MAIFMAIIQRIVVICVKENMIVLRPQSVYDL